MIAILGGSQSVQADHSDIFCWPNIPVEAEEAVLEVLRAGKMSDANITRESEEEYAAAVRRVVARYETLLPGHPGNPAGAGGRGLTCQSSIAA